MITKEEKISRVNRGRTAEVVLQQMEPLHNEQRERILARMKQSYRDGKADFPTLLACVAELCTIDDLEHRLSQKINLGRKATKELNDGASHDDQ